MSRWLVNSVSDDSIEVLFAETDEERNNHENNNPNLLEHDDADRRDTITSSERQQPPGSGVRFSHVEVRNYSVTVGDYPFCSDSCPLTLEWEHTSSFTVSK